MRKIIAAMLLEFYAFLLAGVQLLGGVRTDEAKYLLNIPYPHPPLVRWILSLTAGFPYQELLWRAVFASLLIQAVWVIWHMARGYSDEQRSTIAVLWLGGAAVVLQAGSIMMAPLTALEGLVFLWCVSEVRRGWRPTPWQAAGLGLFWLISLFSAFQIVLYLPLILFLFWKAVPSFHLKVLYFCGPIAVVALFAFSEPQILASFLIAGTKNADVGLAQWSIGLFQAWCVGGSILLGLVGMSGMLLERDWPLALSTLLVGTYVFVSFHLYFAIFFAPLFIVGALHFFRRLARHPTPLIFPFVVVTLLCVFLFPPSLKPTAARATLRTIIAQNEGGDVLIQGDFGHEWEYESPFPVHRLTPALLPSAQAVVCLTACPSMEKAQGWKAEEGAAVPLWIRSVAP